MRIFTSTLSLIASAISGVSQVTFSLESRSRLTQICPHSSSPLSRCSCRTHYRLRPITLYSTALIPDLVGMAPTMVFRLLVRFMLGQMIMLMWEVAIRFLVIRQPLESVLNGAARKFEPQFLLRLLCTSNVK